MIVCQQYAQLLHANSGVFRFAIDMATSSFKPEGRASNVRKVAPISAARARIATSPSECCFPAA
jgi:hypothetical protein